MNLRNAIREKKLENELREIEVLNFGYNDNLSFEFLIK